MLFSDWRKIAHNHIKFANWPLCKKDLHLKVTFCIFENTCSMVFALVRLSSLRKSSFSFSIFASLPDNSFSNFLDSSMSFDNECSSWNTTNNSKTAKITPTKFLIHPQDLFCCEESCRASVILLCGIASKLTRYCLCAPYDFITQGSWSISLNFDTCIPDIFSLHIALDTWSVFTPSSFESWFLGDCGLHVEVSFQRNRSISQKTLVKLLLCKVPFCLRLV